MSEVDEKGLVTQELLELISLQKKISKLRYDSSLSAIFQLIEELKQAREEASADDGRVYFDEKLGQTISEAIGKIGNLLKDIVDNKPPAIDFSKLSKVLKESSDNVSDVITTISKQNNQIIELVAKLPIQQEASNTYNYSEDIINQLNHLIENQNKLISKMVVVDNSKHLTEIAKSISSQPKEWEFNILRDGGKIYKINAKAL